MSSTSNILLFVTGVVALIAEGRAYAGGGGASSNAYASSSASSGSFGGGSNDGGGGAWTGAGSFPGGYGGVPNFGPGPGFGGGFPNVQDPFQFHKYLQEYLAYMNDLTRQAAQAAASNVPCAASDNSVGGGDGGVGYRSGAAGGGSPPKEPVKAGSSGAAVASGNIGPRGGYGSASVYPSAGGDGGSLGDRFGGAPTTGQAGAFPAPASGTYGVSSFSSSSSSDVNGKKSSAKHASVSYNDNGKITTYTASDP